MDGRLIADAESGSDERPHRPSKRRKVIATSSPEASGDGTAEHVDDHRSSSRESPNKDKANGDTDESKVKRPKYRIHEPRNHTMPEDAFFTQPPSRSPSPYRIDKFRWQKPRRPASPTIPSAKKTNHQPTEISRSIPQRHRVAPSIAETRNPVDHPSTNPPQWPNTNGSTSAANSVKNPVSSSQQRLPGQPSSAYHAYDDVLADIPSDAFSSPEPLGGASLDVPIEISSQGPDTQNEALRRQRNPRLVAPLNNLRQTTLFGDDAEGLNTQTQTVRKRNWPLANKDEAATHHKLEREAMSTWVYPTNLGKIRDYQYSIVAKGLYHNMLVALPTGLGKTFIAATIMLNWFRWTTDAQIVFVAPTKPLVSQQVKACFEIAGIPRSATTMLTGVTPPGVRAEEWQSKRVFFMTPQTIVNDLKAGICDPKRLVLLVVDEAHRATGGYAYVEVVQFLRRFNTSFRVLALTATPGASIESVQEVIDGLGISRIEIRTEESLDIREYVYARRISTVLFDYNDEMVMVMDLFAKALQPLVDKVCGLNAYWGKDPMTLTPYGCTQARSRWMSSDAGRKANWGLKSMVNTIFSLLASLAHAIELLKFHGIGPFYHKVLAFRDGATDSGGKGSKYSKQVKESEPFQKLMSRVQAWINNPDFVGHPKLEYLRSVVLNHFLDAAEGRGAGAPSGTRIMVFAHYRDSAEEIARVLRRNEPLIRPRVFVGQANSRGSEGMDQKTQLDVIQKFKTGIHNTLVATSIGEEGLDIGEVDLIVCYDASASPIRMLQRMGRTGRKRAGNIVVTLMKGKEEDNFIKARDGYEKMQKEIAAGTRFNYHEEQSRRIVPREIQPVVDKKVVDIPFENTQAELPEPSKRAKAPKRPPKKFHMPDGVRKGFVKASRLGDDDGSDDSENTSVMDSQFREESPEPLPSLSDVLLNAADSKELERRYLDVKGDSPEIVENPRLDTFPALQRELRPTGVLCHGRTSKRTVRMLQLMHDFAQGPGKEFGKHLDPDDRQEVLSQAQQRAAFFAADMEPRGHAQSSNNGLQGAMGPRQRYASLSEGFSPVPEQPRRAEEVPTTDREGPGDMDPNFSSGLPLPHSVNEKNYQPAQSPSKSPPDSEEELPDFSTLIKRPGTASLAAGVEKTRLPQTRLRKGRKVVVEQDSDEE
ncbi:MAG: hypothetical protein LQ338_006380 [Usnochroma carphineum]|nr:MAG: hypothetical protein LQ338_006380 [Usnochroma carphineum]